ncbi:hypothetical protein LOTGIDRAFT_236219 [Lottia gigantea]|uniref:Uncharacterized protein n=1 Tax=Lottia gigantea TaxID=225164 RepID=V3Z1X3_LOTGI|nr:hypothetical protein LOTGIDRAFT_236219 [Lottia gigantea]ESO84553.1 hypothetical protein LOTGIDRAFT_236219 [Lottia gigantea]
MKFLLSILNFAVLYFCLVESQFCAKDETHPCRCNGTLGVVDLSSLATANNEPRFKDVEELSGTYLYSFSPCTAFNEGGCVGVSGCKTDNSSFYTIGKPSSSNFFYDEPSDKLSITFIANEDTPRSMRVFLVCDPNEEGSLNVTGPNPVGSDNEEMTLTSKYCCFQTGETTTTVPPTTTTTAAPTTTAALTTTPEPDTTSEEPDTTSGSETTEPSGPTEPSEPTSSGPTEPASDSTEPPASGSTEPVTGSSMPASETTVPVTGSTNPDVTTTESSSQSVHMAGVIALVTPIILYKLLN